MSQAVIARLAAPRDPEPSDCSSRAPVCRGPENWEQRLRRLFGNHCIRE